MFTPRHVRVVMALLASFATAQQQSTPVDETPIDDTANDTAADSGDCIRVTNSVFCSAPQWDDFYLDRSLDLFEGQTDLTPATADAIIEGIVKEIEQKLAEKAGCDEQFDLIRARTYQCESIIHSSYENCGSPRENGEKPKRACRNVCEQFLSSGTGGLDDASNCKDRGEAAGWIVEFEDKIDCNELPITDCVGDEMEADTCGILTLDSICEKCENPAAPILRECPEGSRAAFQDVGPSTTVIAVSVGISVGVIILMIAAFFYFRIVRRRRERARRMNAYTKGGNGSDDNATLAASATFAPRPRTSLVGPIAVSNPKQDSMERSNSFTPPSGAVLKSSLPAALTTTNPSPPTTTGHPIPEMSNTTGIPTAIAASDAPNPANNDVRKSKFSQVSKRSSSCALADASQVEMTARNSTSPSIAHDHPARASQTPSSMASRPASQNLSKYNIEPTKYVVVYQYTHQQPDEMDLIPGQVISVSTLYDDGWALGRNEMTGAEGALPQACIVLMENEGST